LPPVVRGPVDLAALARRAPIKSGARGQLLDTQWMAADKHK
jgi:hypothetical protein